MDRKSKKLNWFHLDCVSALMAPLQRHILDLPGPPENRLNSEGHFPETVKPPWGLTMKSALILATLALALTPPCHAEPDCDPPPDQATYTQHTLSWDPMPPPPAPQALGFIVYFKTVASDPWPTDYRCYCIESPCEILERFPAPGEVVFLSVTAWNSFGESSH